MKSILSVERPYRTSRLTRFRKTPLGPRPFPATSAFRNKSGWIRTRQDARHVEEALGDLCRRVYGLLGCDDFQLPVVPDVHQRQPYARVGQCVDGGSLQSPAPSISAAPIPLA